MKDEEIEKWLMDFLSQPVCKMAADLNITVEQMERLLITWSQPNPIEHENHNKPHTFY